MTKIAIPTRDNVVDDHFGHCDHYTIISVDDNKSAIGSQRRVSLYIKEDYIRQRMLNTIVDTLRACIPKESLGEGILKYGIKL